MAQHIPPPPMGHRGPGGPGPGPQQFQGPPQGFPNQMPIRHQSTRLVDLTPPQVMQVMDDATAYKKLTTYSVFSIRKAVPHNLKDKPTWARSDVQEEKLSQEDIIKQLKKLNEKGKTVAEKKLALAPHQSSQVTNLLDDLSAREFDRNFEWTLAQIDRKERIIKHGLKETLTMTVFFKRAPLKDVSAAMMYQNIERARHERMMQQNRPPPQQQQQQQQQQQRPPPPPNHGPPPPPNHGPPPPNHGGGGGGGGPPPQIFKVERKPSQTKLPIPKKDGSRQPPVIKKPHPDTRKKNYHSDSSSIDPYDSDLSYDSDDSGSFNTSISSRDGRKYKDKKRTRSYERKREHQKDYHIDHRGGSPERPGMHHRYSVPEVPRPPIPGFDPLAAAYQAGKLDADAERFGHDQRVERERELLELAQEREMLERERYAQQQPPRQLMIERPVIVQERPPFIIERPVPIDRPLPDRRDQPRAMVSYGRGDVRRMSPPPRGYSDKDVRYVDQYSEPDYFGRQESAEDYMERTRPREYVNTRPKEFIDMRQREYFDTRPREFVDTRPQEYVDTRPREFVVDRRRSDFAGHRPEIRYQTTSRPFAPISLPRRYTGSNDSYR